MPFHSKPILVHAYPRGWTVYYEETEEGSSTASGYVYHMDDTPQECVAAGVPFVDAREMEYAKIVELAFRGPLLEQILDPVLLARRRSGHSQFFGPSPEEGKGLDGCGYGSFDYAPMEVFIRLHESRGARISNYQRAEQPA